MSAALPDPAGSPTPPAPADPTAPAEESRSTFGTVLRQPGVLALWIASLISYLGDTFSAMALFILINQVTHSTLSLAGIGVAQTLPLFLGIVAGVLVDRWRYRPVLLVSDLLRAALVPCYLLFHAASDLWLVLLVAVLAASAARFFSPASSALRRALLRLADYQIAASLWQATIGISYVIGPALAGFTISAFGAQGITVAFLLDSLSFLVSAGIIFFGVRQEAQAVDRARQQDERPTAWADLREGWGFMRASRPIRGVLVLYSVGLLGVGSVFVLAVPYIQRVFTGGPLEIGFLDTAQALGLALGAVGVGTVAATRFSAGSLMLGASLVGGLAVIGLGLAPAYVLALGAMLVAGAAAGTVETAGSAVMLHEIPQQHQGKGSATLDTLLNGAYVTSIALAGVGGDAIGVRNVFVVGGIVALIGVVAATPLLRGAVQPSAAPQANGAENGSHPADSVEVSHREEITPAKSS